MMTVLHRMVDVQQIRSQNIIITDFDCNNESVSK